MSETSASVGAVSQPIGGPILTSGEQDSAVERTYQQLRNMALSFELRPGERVNETEVARKLGVSRTPLREALNRLVSEGLLTFVPTKGFFRIEVKPREIFELYQIRLALEQAAAEMAVAMAADDQIDELDRLVNAFLAKTKPSERDLVVYDEAFHERLAEMSGNRQITLMLRSVNMRIQPIRHVGLSTERIASGQHEHRGIVDALRRRDAAALRDLLRQHISCRFDEVEDEVRRLYGSIYVG